jgi:hypothetical protein
LLLFFTSLRVLTTNIKLQPIPHPRSRSVHLKLNENLNAEELALKHKKMIQLMVMWGSQLAKAY